MRNINIRINKRAKAYVFSGHSLVVELSQDLFKSLLVVVVLLHQHFESLQAVDKLNALLAYIVAVM